MISRSARLLAQSLLAIMCGAVGCDEDKARGPAAAEQEAGSAGAEDGGAAGFAGEAAGGPAFGGAAGAVGVGKRRVGPCVDAVDILVDGAPSGMVKCADGTLARTGQAVCRLADLSGDPPCAVPGEAGGAEGDPRCRHDACLAAPYGRPKPNWPPNPGPYVCVYSCQTDADCPSQLRCACDETGAGTCLQAACASAADCAGAETCRVGFHDNPCSRDRVALQCIAEEDGCVRNEDCDSALSCRRTTGLRACAQGQGACGRPLVLAGRSLVATLTRSTSWC